MSATGLFVSTLGFGVILGAFAPIVFGLQAAWAAAFAGALVTLAGTFIGGPK